MIARCAQAIVLLVALASCARGPELEPKPARPTATAPAARPASAASALYARAGYLLDCATLIEEQFATPGGGASGDAAGSEDPAREARRLACGRSGLSAREQGLSLLRRAAAAGVADAKADLLRWESYDLLERLAQRRTADGQAAAMTAEERRQAEQIVGQLEQQALDGNRDAMAGLEQMLSSGVLASSEPLYAAAWRLAAAQPRGRPLPSQQPLKGEEMLDDLDAQTERQVVALARDLHEMCCARASRVQSK